MEHHGTTGRRRCRRSTAGGHISGGIVEGTQQLLDDRDAYDVMAGVPNPYGDGRAAERIVRYPLDKTSAIDLLRD